jgi:tetratricopeptide (TPR) repeat protein
MALQRGLMDLDRGRYDEALGNYRRADRLFAGYWMIEEHIAELEALRGNGAEAERRYRELVSRTNDPEFMDALGEVLDARGARREAADWHRRAEALYERDLERLPEASYGHALAHFLHHGTAPRALTIARANYRLRPGGEASLRLAQALLRAGDLDGARARIEALLATPYGSAEVHATASLVYAALHVTARADRQEQLARAIRPDALEQLDWLRAPSR